MLYLVATPIGNLNDISQRAVKVLQAADLILCEDTRTTGKLMRLLNVSPYPPLLSYHEHNEQKRIPGIVNRLKTGENIALVSDAGTPAVSDPGFKLVRECLRSGLKVTSVPGPSSIITALVVSGFPTDKFTYVGFLPRSPVKKRQLFEDLEKRFRGSSMTIIAFESPYRLEKTLTAIKEVFGDTGVAICRELTKLHESVAVGPVSELLKKLKKGSKKGEVTLVWQIV